MEEVFSNIIILINMGDTFKCFIGLHKYEVLKEVEVKNVRGEVEAITIISRCSNCGKLKHHVVPVLKGY